MKCSSIPKANELYNELFFLQSKIKAVKKHGINGYHLKIIQNDGVYLNLESKNDYNKELLIDFMEKICESIKNELENLGVEIED